MAESNFQLDANNTVFGRVEYVRKSGEELSVPDPLREQMDSFLPHGPATP